MTVFPPLASLPVPAALPSMPLPGLNADFLAALEAIEAAAPEGGGEAPVFPQAARSSQDDALSPAPDDEDTVHEEKTPGDLAAVFAVVVTAPPPAPAVEAAAPAVEAPAQTSVVEGAAPPVETPEPGAGPRPVDPLLGARPIDTPVPVALPVAEEMPGVDAPLPPNTGREPAGDARPSRPVAAPNPTVPPVEEVAAVEPTVISVSPTVVTTVIEPAAIAAQPAVVTTVKAPAREAAFLKRLANCETKPDRVVPSPAASQTVPESRVEAPAPQAPVLGPVEEATAPAGEPPVPKDPVRPSRNEAAPVRMQLAFGARLAPAPPPVKPATPSPKAPAPSLKPESAPAEPKSDGDQAVAPSAASPARKEQEAEGAARSRALRQPDERPDPAALSADDPPPPPDAPRAAPAARAEREAPPPAEKQPAEVAAPRRTAPELPPAAKGAPVARDIRIEVAGLERRVEVRLVERGGAIDLAVRTPDERLAGDLREHLPSLSSRLEQTGFRADQWHAAEAGGAARRLEVAAAAGSSPGERNEHGQGGGREQQERDERRPAARETRNETQEKGASFEWLMQSLR